MNDSESLNLFAQWALSLMEGLGSIGAGVAVAVENLFLVWTTLGSVVGALALYGLGGWLGPQRLRRIVARVPLMKVADVDRAETWFARHGSEAVFFGRMMPLFRSLISIPAGIERVPILRFTLLTTAGSAVWNTTAASSQRSRISTAADQGSSGFNAARGQFRTVTRVRTVLNCPLGRRVRPCG